VQPLHDIWIGVRDAMMSWHQGKLFIEHIVTIGHDTLHIMVGAMLWLILAMLMRRPITNWQPWGWTLAVIAWNETVDLWNEQWPDAGQQFGEGAKDIMVTMFVPTLILLAARARPDLFRAGFNGRSKRKR